MQPDDPAAPRTVEKQMSDENQEDTLKASTENAISADLVSSTGIPDRYEIKSLLGKGGMGAVFLAYDKQLDRALALKVLAGDASPESGARFLRETKALASLKHPNIVTILSTGLTSNGNQYYAMELVSGDSLAEILRRQKVLNGEEFYSIFSDILSGLIYAHQQKIIHRDLKPSNILISAAPERKAIIIDFGIARIEEERSADKTKTITKTNSVLGSPYYMSPEQCRGERATQLSDIYSLACIMHECLAGRPPFQGDNALETMYKHINEPAPSLEILPRNSRIKRLEELIKKCLDKDPSLRVQSAQELKSSLDNIFAETKDLEPSSSKATKTKMTLSALVALALVSASAYFLLLPFQKHSAGMKSQSTTTQGTLSTRDELTRKIRTAKRRIGLVKVDLQEAEGEKREELMDKLADDHTKLGDALSELADYLDADLRKSTLAEAENTLSEGLSYEQAAPGRKVILLCARARARLKADKLELSQADFDKALLESERTWDKDSGQWIDVYIQRNALLIRRRNYQEAEQCLEQLRYLWRHANSNPGRNTMVHTQYLYLDGPDRPDELYASLKELKKTKPKSQEEAKQQIELAKQLASLFTHINEKQVAGECLAWSEELANMHPSGQESSE